MASSVSDRPPQTDTGGTSSAPKSPGRLPEGTFRTPGQTGGGRAHRRRGRRGQKKFKPYHKMSAEEKRRMEEREEEQAVRKRARTSSFGAPMAPFNTTQFLINDQECRLGLLRHEKEKAAAAAARLRSLSCGSAPEHGEDDRASPSSSEYSLSGASGVSAEDARRLAMDAEFEGEYEQAIFENYCGMSHEELARSMVEMQRSASDIEDQLISTRRDNERLWKVIRKHKLAVDSCDEEGEGGAEAPPIQNGDEAPPNDIAQAPPSENGEEVALARPPALSPRRQAADSQSLRFSPRLSQKTT